MLGNGDRGDMQGRVWLAIDGGLRFLLFVALLLLLLLAVLCSFDLAAGDEVTVDVRSPVLLPTTPRPVYRLGKQSSAERVQSCTRQRIRAGWLVGGPS